MFVPTDRQKSLLECQFLLPPAKATRLKKSWAAPFRERVLPLIDEEALWSFARQPRIPMRPSRPTISSAESRYLLRPDPSRRTGRAILDCYEGLKLVSRLILR